jgi:hypothetical protein
MVDRVADGMADAGHPDTAGVTTADTRPAVASTFVLEKPVDTVWKTLADPAALMWLLPKAVYSIASPEPIDGLGELRGGWVDRVRKGVRLSSVWEVACDEEARRVTFHERGHPNRRLTLSFQLSSEAGETHETHVVIALVHNHPRWKWWATPLIGRPNQTSLKGLEERLRKATEGELPDAINGQRLTMAPGTGAKKQANAIVISAAPKLIWTIAGDKDATLVPAPDRLASWRRVIDEVEFLFAFRRTASGALTCSMARVSVDGPYRVTTVDALGVEVLYELLPKEGDCLLRTTHRWTALLKSKDIRKAAELWLQQVKEIAERE